jgi:hypothetical protein
VIDAMIMRKENQQTKLIWKYFSGMLQKSSHPALDPALPSWLLTYPALGMPSHTPKLR